MRKGLIVLVFLGVMFLPSDVAAHGEEKHGGAARVRQTVPVEAESREGAELVDKVEQIEEVEVFSPDAAQDSPSLAVVVGRVHPAMVHFPIAWLVLLLVVDLTGFMLGKRELTRWGLYVLAGTVLSIVPAVTTGLLNYAAYREAVPLALLHRNIIFLMSGLCVTALILRLSRSNNLQGVLLRLYLGLIVAANLLIMVAASLGGKLVFGPDYLPF